MRVEAYDSIANFKSQGGVARMILNGWNEDVPSRLDKLKKMKAHEFKTDEAYIH